MKAIICRMGALVLGSVLVQSCGTLDNYMLGKDNTLKPSELKPIHSKVKMAELYNTPIGKSHKPNAAYLKLKPVVKNGVIYTADVSGMVQAVSKYSGKVKWSRQLDHGVLSGPTVHRGYIALGTNASTVVLLDAYSGAPRWQVNVSGDVLSKPIITKNKVLAKTIDGNVYALDLVTGNKLWGSNHGAPNLILKASSSPVVVGPLALVGFSDGKLDAIELKSGRVAWQRSIAFATGASDVERLVDIDADPIVQNKVAYLASYQGYVGALSLDNGQFIWQKPASVYKNMSMDGNTLYLTDSDDVVWALNRQNGHVLWKQEDLKGHVLTEPVRMGHRLVTQVTDYLIL